MFDNQCVTVHEVWSQNLRITQLMWQIFLHLTRKTNGYVSKYLWGKLITVLKLRIKTRERSSVEPCGTPRWIESGFDLIFSTATYCVLLSRKLLNQWRGTPPIPYLYNFCSTKFYGPNEPKHGPIKALNLYREPKGDQR